MQYFNNCNTLEEVKHLYKQLAKQFHPDKGGDTATMQAINSEYAFACAKILKGENLSSDEMNEQIELSEKYRQAIEQVINLPNITVEVVGNWIWVTGNTKPHCSKTRGGTGILHDAGFKWANKKEEPSAWFFRTEEYKTRGGKKSLDEIRNKYGSSTIKGTYAKSLR